MNTFLKVVVVDDEPLARDRLVTLVKQAGEQVSASFLDVEQALEWFSSHQADVALLDVRLAGKSGIDLAIQLSHMQPAPLVIFTTAFDRHAVDAFGVAAVDYLLKPIRLTRLKEAFSRARVRLSSGSQGQFGSEDTQQALMNLDAPNITVRTRDKIRLISVYEARYLKAEHKYVTLFAHGREYVLDESLVQLEQHLGKHVLRIHRNCLVMRHAIEGIERIQHSTPDGAEASWVIHLKDIPEPLPISRRQLSVVRQSLSSTHGITH